MSTLYNNKIKALVGILELAMRGIFAPVYVKHRDEHARLTLIQVGENGACRVVVKFDGDDKPKIVDFDDIDEKHLPFAPGTHVTDKDGDIYPYTVNKFSWTGMDWSYEISRTVGHWEAGQDSIIERTVTPDEIRSLDSSIHVDRLKKALKIEKMWIDKETYFFQQFGKPFTLYSIEETGEYRFYRDLADFWDASQEGNPQ